ncbi:MAG: ADP-glyceromanno-heptose 6-epimerase [Lentisphaeria bacterium]|nr:ADP-glyceromanno-heptose 6-epimerase [Lentisphaeria bacterium]
MKYIVTGAAGLIGSAVVHALNQRGETDILAVDHLGSTTEKWKNLRALRFTDYMEKEEFFASLDTPDPIFSDAKAIIHMGACSSTTETDASYLARNNYECTKKIASLAVGRGIRFLYASSAATYGDGSCGYSDDESGIEQLRPLNMYGYSKQMFDLWAKRHGMLDRITGVKFTNVYGPNERHKGSMRSMVCRAFEQIRDTGKVRLFRSDRPDYADGEQKRDFLYVKDAADMVLFLLKDPALCGLYNVGSGKAETWNELAKAVFDAMNVPVNIEYIDMPDHLKGKYQYYTCADMSKMKKAGYPREILSLHDAIRDDVVNYLLPDKYLGD